MIQFKGSTNENKASLLDESLIKAKSQYELFLELFGDEISEEFNIVES